MRISHRAVGQADGMTGGSGAEDDRGTHGVAGASPVTEFSTTASFDSLRRFIEVVWAAHLGRKAPALRFEDAPGDGGVFVKTAAWTVLVPYLTGARSDMDVVSRRLERLLEMTRGPIRVPPSLLGSSLVCSGRERSAE